MIVVSNPVLEAVRDILSIFGWVGIISAGAWSIKEYLSFKSRNKQTLEAALSSSSQIAGVKAAVDTMMSNHMVHLQNDVTAVQTTMGKHFDDFIRINDNQLQVLRSIDTNISILKDRGERPTRTTVTVEHPDVNV